MNTAIDTGTNELLCNIRDRVAIITLNRPDARNALSDHLTPALRTMTRSCGENPQVGALLITGASASVKGYAQSAPFAMGKFALRGLAQSMARELSPLGIHVAHFVIDGGIRSSVRTEPADRPDSMLDPDAIALSYWNVLRQPRSAWTWELELRPWVEKL